MALVEATVFDFKEAPVESPKLNQMVGQIATDINSILARVSALETLFTPGREIIAAVQPEQGPLATLLTQTGLPGQITYDPATQTWVGHTGFQGGARIIPSDVIQGLNLDIAQVINDFGFIDNTGYKKIRIFGNATEETAINLTTYYDGFLFFNNATNGAFPILDPNGVAIPLGFSLYLITSGFDFARIV